MIYAFQSLSLKTRFLGVLLLFFPVLGFSWLYTGTPWALAQLKILSHGAGIPDMLFWYTPQVLQDLIDAWGPDGRMLYLTILWPTDLGFMVAYGVFLTAATLYLLKKANPAHPWFYLLALVPLLAAGFDFLENCSVALAVLFTPDGTDFVGWPAACFTAAKWSALGLSAAVLVVGTVVNLIRLAVMKFRETFPKEAPPMENSEEE